MTKRFVTGLALLLLLQLSAGLVIAAPPSDGSTVRIVEDTTWSDLSRSSMDALKSHRARRSPSPLRMRWRRVRPSTSRRVDRSSFKLT